MKFLVLFCSVDFLFHAIANNERRKNDGGPHRENNTFGDISLPGALSQENNHPLSLNFLFS